MEGRSRVRKWNAESDGAFALLLKVNKNLENSEKKKNFVRVKGKRLVEEN